MISKEEYKWLEHHTDILNNVPDLNDYAQQNIKFKAYRPSHIQKIKDIFKEYQCVSGHNKNDIWIKIKGLTIDDFNDIACGYSGDLIYDMQCHDINYIPMDKKYNYKIIRRSSANLLSNLSNRKKLDILFSFAQTIFISEEKRKKHLEFIEQNSAKFLALLQLKIPADFMRNEYQKVQKITKQLLSLPNIKNKLKNFALLPPAQQFNLVKEASRITAEVNGVTPPKVHFITSKQANNDSKVADWVQTDAYADFQDIYINKDLLKSYSGIEALSLAFHETTHIAQSNADYLKYPEMEEMFSHRLGYLQNHADIYMSIPMEMVTYNLEQEFCEQLDTKLKMKMCDYSYETEYNIAQQYMIKALRRAR